MIEGKTWGAIVQSDKFSALESYKNAVVQLGALQASAKLDEMEQLKQEIPSGFRPNIAEPDKVFQAAMSTEKPIWWPRSMDRIEVKVTLRRNGETPEHLSPHPVDPNHLDLGQAEFMSVIRSRLEAGGEEFEGQIQIKIIRRTDKGDLGGWRGEVYVGEKPRKEKKNRNDESTAREEMFDLMKEQFEKSNESQQRMFGNASNVIHASASAINAMRGANAPPPWMRGEGEDGTPMWMFMAQEAMKMVATSGVFGTPQTPTAAQVGMNVMSHPVQRPGALGGYGQANPMHQLPGPVQQDLGYGGYQNHAEPGDYDGVYAHDDDLVDDGFEEEDPFEEEDEFLYEEDEDEDDDDEEDEPPPRRSKGKGKQKKTNPLAGMSPEEIQQALSEMIDQNPHRKDEFRAMGMSLAQKILR